MMHHLDSDDMRLLGEALTQFLRGLLDEIAHTDDREFREELRTRYERVDALRRRLTSPPAEASLHG